MYVATPAVFKTPIVNVTHSERRRHIAAFLMRGRVLCAKLTMQGRREALQGDEDSAGIVNNGAKED